MFLFKIRPSLCSLVPSAITNILPLSLHSPPPFPPPAHHLILSYGLYQKMEVYRPHLASSTEMTSFHSEDYISFLSRITPDNLRNFSTQMSKFNAGEFTDCPVFDNLFEFTQIYAGCSIDAAIKLNNSQSDIGEEGT